MDNSRYRPFMIINITVDLCSVLGGISNSPFTNLFANQLRKYSNLFQPCPLRGHLYVKEHNQDIKDFPPIIPVGFYHTHFIYYTAYKNDDHVVMVNEAHFEAIPKGIERF